MNVVKARMIVLKPVQTLMEILLVDVTMDIY